MALSTGRITKEKGPTYGFRTESYPVAADAVGYAGGMACLDASGYLVAAADTAGLSDVVGIIQADFDNTGGSNGDFLVGVKTGIHEITNSGLAQIDVGKNCAVQDDETVELGSASTNKVRAGRVVKYVSATSVWVDIGNPAPPRIFVSGELTGDAGEESVPHGFGSVPWRVLVSVTDNNAGDAVITEGTHTATNVLVTVTNAVKYKVFASHG